MKSSTTLSFIKKNVSPITPIKQNCNIQRTCESCLYVNQSYQDGLKLKFNQSLKVLQDRQILTRTRVLPPVACEQIFSYRSTLKLAVRKSEDASLKIGLFHPGTHNVVEIAECPLHLPVLRRMLGRITPLLQAAAKEGKIKAWDETEVEGELRYLVARASHSTDEIQITFVVTHTDNKNFYRELIRDLKNNNFKVVSAFLNVNTSRGNDIFGESYVQLSGQEQLRISLNGTMFSVSPGSFLQVNPWQAEKIYSRIGQLIGVSERRELAWDLYCGMGPIALMLAKNNFRVWGVEENPHAISDAKQNMAREEFAEEQIQFQCSSIEEAIDDIPSWSLSPSFIVVNPSRRGLSEKVREKLANQLSGNNRLQYLIYVSCEMQTLARDLETLLATGARLNQIEAFDMFPHTEKLEWLAVITPANERNRQ